MTVTAPGALSTREAAPTELKRDSRVVHDNLPLTHLQRLEAESIYIIREVIAEVERPVMLYSAGKDSAVMLHLARKAFYPSIPPFPLLHVDTTWKFKAMYEHRDRIDSAYEAPENPEIHIDTTIMSAERAAELIMEKVLG
jgi:3'-phosphoadenosine 5'-phosphosulfate sulfotransferase (PAPS reductase)/FAD synthetase